MSSKSTTWHPRNHKADFKTIFYKNNFKKSLVSTILILPGACGNLSCKLFLAPEGLVSVVKCRNRGLSKLLNTVLVFKDQLD